MTEFKYNDLTHPKIKQFRQIISSTMQPHILENITANLTSNQIQKTNAILKQICQPLINAQNFFDDIVLDMSTTKTITSKILSNIDISLLNHQAKYFYDNISDTIDIEFDENDLYIANIVQ